MSILRARHHLMHLDDVACGVVKENLRPAGHAPNAVVREKDALVLKVLFDRLNVIGPKSNVAAVDRIYMLPNLGSQQMVFLGQMKFHRTIGYETGLPGIKLLALSGGAPAGKIGETESFHIESSHFRYLG